MITYKAIMGTIAAGLISAGTAVKSFSNDNLEEKILIDEGKEKIVRFESGKTRSLGVDVKMEEETYLSFKNFVLRIEQDKGKRLTEDEVYRIMLGANTENLSELTSYEMRVAWESYGR